MIEPCHRCFPCADPVNPVVQTPVETLASVTVFPQEDAGLTLKWNTLSAYTEDGG